MNDNTRSTALAVAPNGGRKTRADHPSLPITPDELARTAAECLEAGAAMIHLHVREANGGHLLDADAYRETISAIREAVGDRLVLQITSEALGIYQPAEQMRVVRETRPEAVSLALREFVPDEAAEKEFASFLQWIWRERIMPQIILYDADDKRRLADLQARGMLPWDDVPVLYVLGRYTKNQQSQPSDLLPFLSPETRSYGHWMVCAFGREEAACVATAALLGGHVRVGLENNLLLPDGTTAASNAALVEAAANIIRPAGKTLATAAELRENWLSIR